MTFTELLADINFFCGSTSASYPLADKTRNINQAYHNVSRIIWEAADGWQYDDRNKSDLPKIFKTLTAGTQDYTVPTTAQRIERIEIQDNNNDWVKLKPLDYKDISVALEEKLSTDGLPMYYDLVGNYITLYPAPASGDVTLASGMAIRVSRDVTEFPTTASTGTPGFATQFHRLLSISASLDFEKDRDQRNLLLEMKARLEKGIQRFYGKREVEGHTAITPFGRKRQRQYE